MKTEKNVTITSKPAADKAGKQGKAQKAKDDKTSMVQQSRPSYVIQTKSAFVDDEKKEEMIRRKLAGSNKNALEKDAFRAI